MLHEFEEGYTGGSEGATGALPAASLSKLRELMDQSLPTEMTAPPKP